MAISFAHRGRLWIVMDEENVERIQQRDPFDFDSSKSPGILTLRLPLQITVTYARKDEMPKIQELCANADELVKYLSRGFKVTGSDHDRPYDVYDSLGPVPPKVKAKP